MIKAFSDNKAKHILRYVDSTFPMYIVALETVIARMTEMERLVIQINLDNHRVMNVGPEMDQENEA